MYNLIELLIGADIEVFLKRKDSSELVSAEGYIPGEKHDPFRFDEGYILSLDNVSAEFGIPPARNVTDWVTSINKSMEYINDIIPEDLCTVILPAGIFDVRYLRTKNAKKFGCESDFNVWSRSVNPTPKAKNKLLRSCGGHIHIGYSDITKEGVTLSEDDKFNFNEKIIKVMDLFVGIPSVIQEPDNERKLLYGKAGAFRIKSYGVEYRTVSNYYLENDSLKQWAFENTKSALDYLCEKDIDEVENVGEFIQHAINDNDKVMAGNLIRQFNINMV